jgi:hypothetical protein
VLAFNLGVEIGQMAALVLMYIVADVISNYIPRLRDHRLSNIALITAGVLAAGFLAVPASPNRHADADSRQRLPGAEAHRNLPGRRRSPAQGLLRTH